jgi:hypothetical protein
VQIYFEDTTADGKQQPNFVSALVLNSVSPFILLMFNYIFIPTLVAWTTYFEEIESYSARHRNNLLKQFIYMMINTVFIQITQTTSRWS